jgi:multiple sugar transport system substrate-binding protein
LAVALVGCGCSGRPAVAPPPAPRWPGVTLHVTAPSGPPRRLVERLGRAWATTAGATLAIEAPAGDWPVADLVLILAPDLPRWAAANKATPLPRPDDVDAFMPLYRTRLLLWDGKPFALPVLGDAPICVYRRDLYTDAAAQLAYRQQHHKPLRPPETWDEFADQAAFFAARRSRPSLPPLPAADAGLCAAFGAVAAPLAVRAVPVEAGQGREARSAKAFSFQYDVDTGEPRLTEPGFVEALALLQRIQPYRAATATAAEAMRVDQVALGAVTLADLGQLSPEQARRWGVFRTPGGKPAVPGEPVNAVPYLGAGAVVGIVPATSTHAEAAFELLTRLASPDASTEVVNSPDLGGGPFRDRHVTQEQGWLDYGLDNEQTALLRTYLREVADPRVENPGLALRTPGQSQHVAALAAQLRAALAGGDAAMALRTAADQWKKLDGDTAKARADYRRSVGLSP